MPVPQLYLQEARAKSQKHERMSGKVVSLPQAARGEYVLEVAPPFAFLPLFL